MAKKDKGKAKPAKQMKQKVKKTTKKSFFKVEAPLTSTNIEIYAARKEDCEGKTIKLDLTKSLRGKNLELIMRVKHEDDSLIAIPETSKLTSSFVRRAVRKGTDYVEDSFEAPCRDSIARIKPLLVTRRRVSRAVLNALREAAKKWILAYVKTRTAKELFSDIIANKIQKQLAQKLKNIYPLALCEIRMFTVLKYTDSEEKKE